MSTVTIIPEVTSEEVPELLVAVQESGLAVESAHGLLSVFSPFAKDARSLIAQSAGVTDTKLARAFRLRLRETRVKIERAREQAKENSLRTGKAIDGMANVLKFLIVPEEERLSAIEKAEEIKEAARKAKLKTDREEALKPYGIDTTFYQLGEMPDDSWSQLLENTRAAHEVKQAAARKAEEDRIRQENDRLKEEARIREENARLKREADEREAAAKVERDRVAAEKAAADAALLAERERVAREQAEAAEAARRERAAIEAKARYEREETERVARVERERIQAENAARLAEIERNAEAERVLAAKKAAAAKRKADEAAAAVRARVAEQKRIADEVLAKERARTKQLEDEAAAKALAELREKEAAEKTRRDAELAPEREKILAFAAMLVALDVPKLESDGGQIVQKAIVAKLATMTAWLKSEARTL